MPPRRIDTHCHVVPPDYGKWMSAHPLYVDVPKPLPEWSLEGMLEHFAANQVESGILSLTTPGVWAGEGADIGECRYWARRVNEFCADRVRDAPRQFGFLATVPLPDVDAAIDEVRYALEDLNADGVTLLSNVDGVYLGDPELDPLLKELNDRAAVVFVHPTQLPARRTTVRYYGLIDFLNDTTRAAMNLALNECINRFPRMKIVLSHGGGFVPYAALRIARFPGIDKNSVISQLQTLYFDTASVGGPYALPSLLAFAQSERITFGTDAPFVPVEVSVESTRGLDEFPMSDEQRHAIDRGNAERLFPRLAVTQTLH